MRSERAKALAPLGGRPMIAWVVEAARRAGCAPIITVLGHDRDAVAAVLPPGVRWVEQPAQRGTGDAARCAERELGSREGWLLVLPGDMPFLRPETLSALVAEAKAGEARGAAGALLSCPVGPESTFGRIVRGADGRAARIVEYKDAGEEEKKIPEGNAGVYCLRPAALFRALREVRDENAQREYYLTDVVEILAREGAAPAVVSIGDGGEARSVDTPESLAEAERILAGGGRGGRGRGGDHP